MYFKVMSLSKKLGRCILAFICWLLVCFSAPITGGITRGETLDLFYLNSFGESKTYQISAYFSNGLPASTLPVVTPKSIGNSVEHVAWPSAVMVDNDEVLLFVSAFEGGFWKRVYLLRSKDGLNFGSAFVVFEASYEEPFGIGPTHVTYDPGTEEPFIMFYLKRGQLGPGPSINLARSKDGRVWKRYGEVLHAKGPEEAAGLSISWACRRLDGEWILFYQRCASIYAGSAGLARKPDLLGITEYRVTMLEGDGVAISVVCATAKQNKMLVDRPLSIRLGMPHLIIDMNGTKQEVGVPTGYDGEYVIFDRAFANDWHGALLVSMARQKIDPSYFAEHADGSWSGFVTVFGPWPQITAELTTRVAGQTILGPWDFVGDGLSFSPLNPEGVYSTENPARITRNTSCTDDVGIPPTEQIRLYHRRPLPD